MPKTIPYADRFSDESLVQYLLRLVTTIIATHSPQGELRIPLQDLIENAEGCGFVKSWDSKTRELVLRHAAEHTEAYFRANTSPALPPVQPKQPVPISRTVPLGKRLDEKVAVGTHIDLNKASRVVHSLLTDERAADQDMRQIMRDENKLREFMEK